MYLFTEFAIVASYFEVGQFIQEEGILLVTKGIPQLRVQLSSTEKLSKGLVVALYDIITSL